MGKFDWRNVKLRKVNIDDLSDRGLLVNVYATQAVTFLIAMAVVWFQGQSILKLMRWPASWMALAWGLGFALLVIVADLAISRIVPEDYSDDGGVNERVFKRRSVWHIALLSLIVAICEELLFRGAVQYALGAYWTSIVFATIHVRYLRHWLMTGLVFSISYGLGWIYVHTGSLWTPIAAHFAIDFVMGLIIKYKKEETPIENESESD